MKKKCLISMAVMILFSSFCFGGGIKIPTQVNPRGKYRGLIQVLPCPADRDRYGNYYDYGYWKGGRWCGEQGLAGYWVWLYPNWYVFKEKRGVGELGPLSSPAIGSLGQQGRVIRQWAIDARASSEYGHTSWSAKQATGSPDVTSCGDYKRAWAPKPNGSSPEWIMLTFRSPVYATKLRVHETYNAGFIYQVVLVDIEGNKHIVWRGRDNTPCPGWFELTIKRTPYLVKKVILKTQKPGWEEVDAVQLIGIR